MCQVMVTICQRDRALVALLVVNILLQWALATQFAVDGGCCRRYSQLHLPRCVQHRAAAERSDPTSLLLSGLAGHTMS
jgi:hypothetical protein